MNTKTSMSRRTSTLLLTALALTALPACGLFNALDGPRQGSGSGDGGTDPTKDGGDPDPDAGDMGLPPACEEGKADRCNTDEMCLGGECLPRCTFGPAGANNQPRVTPNPGGALTCASDEVCIPTAYQDINYFGACVSEVRAQELRATSPCDDVDLPQNGSYCPQLLQDQDASCEDDRCIKPCANDSDCDRDEHCEIDDDGAGACIMSFCEDAPDPALACAQLFNQIEDEHPNGGDFTRDNTYCLNNQCYIRIDDEARQACAGADSDACKDDQACVDDSLCLDTCESSDECGELVCAFTVPIDEGIFSDDDVSPFVCVDYATLNPGQIADPIEFCETAREDEVGVASWDRATQECVYGTRSFSGSVRYAYIQDASIDCAMNGNEAGDLPGFADPGPDIAFIGLSNNSAADPISASIFEDVYAIGRVVKRFRAGAADNDLPGYGHLDGQRLENENRFSPSSGCPTDPPAPNNTIALGCGGGVFVEFAQTGNPDQVLNLDNEGSNKYIVVSEYNSMCGTSGQTTGVFEQYKVASCAAGVSVESLTPDDCTNVLLNVTVSMPEAEGPAAFAFE